MTAECSVLSREAVGVLFFENGCIGMEELESGLKAYFPAGDFSPERQQLLESSIGRLRELGFDAADLLIRRIPDADWGSKWREGFRPIRITPRLVVAPPWDVPCPSSGSETVITIMPRMAFGTGTHETTRLCLELLESRIRPSEHILDLGTGSGILAIAAARWGAGWVLALDIDPDALDNAQENARANRVEDRVEIRLGSIEAIGNERFDRILANLDRTTIFSVLPALKTHAFPRTGLILSGILVEERDPVEKFVLKAGFRIEECRHQGEWIGMAAVPA